MSNLCTAAGNEPLVSRMRHWEAVTKALNMFVGRGKRFSNKDCEDGAGVPARMMGCYRQKPDTQEWRPLRPEEFASLVCFLGPGFSSAYMAAINSGQAAYWLPEGDPNPGDLAADNADDNAVITRAARDGVFDRQERAELTVVGARMVERGAKLVALTGRAA